MKKGKLLLLTAFMLSFFIAKAQNTEQGDKIINFGIGLGNNYFSGSDYSTTFPPLNASFEIIVKDKLFSSGKGSIGVGGQLGYVGYKYSYEGALSGTAGTFDLDLGLGDRIVGLADLSVPASVNGTSASGTSVSEWKYSRFIVGPRGYLHYSFIDKLDTYTSLMLGAEFYTAKGAQDNEPESASSSVGFVWSWYVGGRYYFTDQLAAMLELGYGVTYANIGIAYKFNK